MTNNTCNTINTSGSPWTRAARPGLMGSASPPASRPHATPHDSDHSTSQGRRTSAYGSPPHRPPLTPEEWHRCQLSGHEWWRSRAPERPARTDASHAPRARVLATTTRHCRIHDNDHQKRTRAPSGRFSGPASTPGPPIPHAGHKLLPEPPNSSPSSSIHQPRSSLPKPTSHIAKPSTTIISYPDPKRKNATPPTHRRAAIRTRQRMTQIEPTSHFIMDHHR
jgi:hypothetical protein